MFQDDTLAAAIATDFAENKGGNETQLQATGKKYKQNPYFSDEEDLE